MGGLFVWARYPCMSYSLDVLGEAKERQGVVAVTRGTWCNLLLTMPGALASDLMDLIKSWRSRSRVC